MYAVRKSSVEYPEVAYIFIALVFWQIMMSPQTLSCARELPIALTWYGRVKSNEMNEKGGQGYNWFSGMSHINCCVNFRLLSLHLGHDFETSRAR